MRDDYRIDGTKIHFHPRRVAEVMEADTWEKTKKVYPIYWEITTSAACNHRCTFCSVDAIGYPAILMDAMILKKRIGEAYNAGVKSVMFAGTGEPLLHRSINDIVSVCFWHGMDAAFTTNGVLLHKLSALPLCKWVKISLNAGSAENYARIHKTDEEDWFTVWENIENAAKRKGNCALGVQCVVLPENVAEMDDLAARARDSGVDYFVLKPYSQATFSIVQRDDIDYRKMQDTLSAIPVKYNTDKFHVVYRFAAMRQEGEPHHYDKCRATPLTWVYSMANGDVFSCSAHLLDKNFLIGNLNTQTFQEIWEGDGRKRNWEMMQQFDIKNCRLNCRMNGTNIYLDQLAHGIPHANYI